MDFLQQFKAIDHVLTNTRQYWQILPFQFLTLPWRDNSALNYYLNTLTMEQIETIDSDDQLLRTIFSRYLDTSLDCIAPLTQVNPRITDCPDRFKVAIKGRKWQQIERFEALVPRGNSEVLEWCAGKGHLGRLISFHQQRPVVSIEWQQAQCDQGQKMSDKFELEQSFIQADVLKGQQQLIKPDQQLVALHACGDLHVVLLQQAVAVKSKQLLIAPCCYHLIGSTSYQALSFAGQASGLTLNRRDLNLSMQKTVVAGVRDKKHRAIEVAWRLGFDLLQRKLRGIDQYLPLPSVRQSMLMGSFSQFCQWACDKKGLSLDLGLDVASFEQAGWQRRLTNARIEIVTHAFRQLLERWLLLDRVLFLEQQGYEVELANFCDAAITPRNAIIRATLR